jgi:signal peptide peptidase SppA
MGKMRQFRREIRSCPGKPLAFHMKSGYGAVVGAMLERVGRGERVHDSEIHDMMADSRNAGEDDGEPRRILIEAGPRIIPNGTAGKAIAIVSMRGVANYNVEFQPYCFSTALLAQTMSALASNPDVGTIVLDIDSPGGMVTGTVEAADAVAGAAKKKTVVALVNPLCASAAYWIASQASEIIATKSADIGSVGVFMAHTDCSKFNEQNGMKITYIFAGEHKVEGNPDEPLSDDAKAYYQGEVDSIYSDFVKAVARGRGISTADVLANFGQGRTLMAANAKAVGMIDQITTVDGALARWGISTEPMESRRRGEAAAEGEKPAAEVPVDPPAQPAAEQPAAPVVVPAGDEPHEQAVTTEGCGKITIRQDTNVSHYVLEPWPARVQITPEAMTCCPSIMSVDGDNVTVTMANGKAVYHKDGVTPHGDWVCALQSGSTYEPPPPVANQVSKSGAEKLAPVPALPEPDADSVVAARGAARRRRLALLSA